MDTNLAGYVVRYYSRFMSEQEGLAYNHLCYTAKYTGESDPAAQRKAKAKFPYSKMLSNDPAVLELARHGMQTLVLRVAKKIFAERGNQMFINRCPRCQALARTPKARQCPVCKHDWHDAF